MYSGCAALQVPVTYDVILMRLRLEHLVFGQGFSRKPLAARAPFARFVEAWKALYPEEPATHCLRDVTAAKDYSLSKS